MHALTTKKKARLSELERQMQKHAEGIGKCLQEIHRDKLYRVMCDTFEEYCKRRWGFTPNYARRILSFENIKHVLKSVPIGTIPENEAQARPLTKLPASEQPAAWTEAVKSAPNGKVTAKHVEEAVTRHLNWELALSSQCKESKRLARVKGQVFACEEKALKAVERALEYVERAAKRTGFDKRMVKDICSKAEQIIAVAKREDVSKYPH